MMLLGALIGCVSSGIIFMIATKMNRRTATLDELKVLLNKASMLGLESANPSAGTSMLSITGKSNITRSSNLDNIKAQYINTVDTLYKQCQETAEKQLAKLVEYEKKYLHYDMGNAAPQREYEGIVASINDLYKAIISEIEEHFRKVKKKGILPLEDIRSLSYLKRMADPSNSWWLENAYLEQDEEIRKHLDAIEKIEEEYKSLQEKYDSGYLVDIITRINRVRKIKEKFLKGEKLPDNDMKYVFNALNKVQSMNDISSLVEKELSAEISVLKQIRRDYTFNNSEQRTGYETLAQHLAEWLLKEDWGRNPREAIQEARSSWREMLNTSFPSYKHYY